LIAILSLLLGAQATATSHSFVYGADRAYRQNPTAENQSKLEHARTKAAFYDGLLYAIPLVPILVVGAMAYRSKRKR
jgi:hypothetical protein